MRFEIIATCGTTRARQGVLETAHGAFETPAFMPVGTQATVKAIDPRELAAHGVGCVLSNAYHLALRPGERLIQSLGGLHAFMGWDGAILTDSGGFQVLSLDALREVDDDGVRFRSHLDGVECFLDPERVMEIQHLLGADIAMVLDECVGFPSAPEAAARAVERTQRWAERSLRAHSHPLQALFGIVQGGVYPELRTASARGLSQLDFDGFAIGGLSVGEPRSATRLALEAVIPHLPAARPRYLMGVGAPEDLIELVGYGIDLFDCVLPTRLGRTGSVFTFQGRVNLRQSRWAESGEPIDPECVCSTCRQFSRAYLHHLYRAGETVVHTLASLHNVAFLVGLIDRLRRAIRAGRYGEERDMLLASLGRAPHLALVNSPSNDVLYRSGTLC